MIRKRLLPVRTLSESSDRLSQSNNMEKILPTLKEKLFADYSDKFTYSTKHPFDIEILIDGKKVTYAGERPADEVLYPSTTKPTMIYLATIDVSRGSAHALLAIVFPREHMIDIVSTYSLEIDSLNAIQYIFSYSTGIEQPIVNDVSCLSIKPIITRNINCYNLQSEDTAEIGWCVSWMVKFSEILSQKSKEEFWGQTWDKRRLLYKNIYDSFVSIPNFNSMEVGKTNWNSIITRYNSGGKRRKTIRRRKSRSKTNL